MRNIREEFIAFLRMTPEKEYNYYDTENCALAQFGQFREGVPCSAGGSYYRVPEKEKEVHVVQCAKVPDHDYATFGQLANELESKNA